MHTITKWQMQINYNSRKLRIKFNFKRNCGELFIKSVHYELQSIFYNIHLLGHIVWVLEFGLVFILAMYRKYLIDI